MVFLSLSSRAVSADVVHGSWEESSLMNCYKCQPTNPRPGNMKEGPLLGNFVLQLGSSSRGERRDWL